LDFVLVLDLDIRTQDLFPGSPLLKHEYLADTEKLLIETDVAVGTQQRIQNSKVKMQDYNSKCKIAMVDIMPVYRYLCTDIESQTVFSF